MLKLQRHKAQTTAEWDVAGRVSSIVTERNLEVKEDGNLEGMERTAQSWRNEWGIHR
jgi:hypothetical protein